MVVSLPIMQPGQLSCDQRISRREEAMVSFRGHWRTGPGPACPLWTRPSAAAQPPSPGLYRAAPVSQELCSSERRYRTGRRATLLFQTPVPFPGSAAQAPGPTRASHFSNPEKTETWGLEDMAAHPLGEPDRASGHGLFSFQESLGKYIEGP